MAKRIGQICVICAILAMIPWLVRAYSGGPPPRRTGAPGDRTCLDAGCHSGTSIPNSSAVRLQTPLPLTYVPGGPVERWVLSISDDQARAFGFQLSARPAAGAEITSAGRLKEIDATTQVVAESGLQFIQHNQPRLNGEFSLDWTPPLTDVGEIIVYVAANASVAGQRSARIHFRTFALRPAARDRAVNAAGLSGEISSGAWGSIFGSNLAKTTRSWNSADFHNGSLPTFLDGVRVTVNGRAAAISYVSPSQINFQAPDDETLGPAAVEVRVDDQIAGSWSINRRAAAPGLFSFANGGREYAAAVHADGSLISDTKPAQPGEVIAIFANGLGPTSPPVPSGRMFSGAAALLQNPAVTIGSVPARVEFAGIVGAGLYQVNAIVPELASGDYEIRLTVMGQSTQARVYLPVTK